MRLHFREYGKGPPLIILHGLFGSLDNWGTISERLSAFFHVYAVDQRNHGRSPHTDEMDYPLMAEDLRAFMTDHSLSRIQLLGHSMGGKAAMQFALMHPDKVERVVAVDIAPRAYPPAHEDIFKALLGLKLETFANRSQIEESLAPSIPDLSVRRFLLKSLDRDAQGVFRWKFNLTGLHQNYFRLNAGLETGKSFEKPALFIRGERSDYIRDADRPLIRQLFPRAEVREVSGAGHWVHVESPEKLFEIVHDFFAQTFLTLPA